MLSFVLVPCGFIFAIVILYCYPSCLIVQTNFMLHNELSCSANLFS